MNGKGLLAFNMHEKAAITNRLELRGTNRSPSSDLANDITVLFHEVL